MSNEEIVVDLILEKIKTNLKEIEAINERIKNLKIKERENKPKKYQREVAL